MSSALTPDELQSYTSIIDAILATADLETISRKAIRHGLQQELGGKDLSSQRDAIKNLIVARFDAVSGANEVAAPQNKRGASDETYPSASPEPARKKAKRSSSVEDADARLAAQLQAEENSLARNRKTRGGDKAKGKAAPRKKRAKKVKDNSDGDGEATPKRRAGGGFQKPFILSETLSELCGETQLSRPQVVKKLWEHIKGNELQDPNDKRQIICDEKMYAVFKQARVDMFRMNKDIGSHLYPVEE